MNPNDVSNLSLYIWVLGAALTLWRRPVGAAVLALSLGCMITYAAGFTRLSDLDGTGCHQSHFVYCGLGQPYHYVGEAVLLSIIWTFVCAVVFFSACIMRKEYGKRRR